ncbi:MAG: outer membrane protein assembly factor BamA [Pantoea sp. Brub]|nr:outer membrane protein assembly factor BamA [Pantoea sp. Brub]
MSIRRISTYLILYFSIIINASGTEKIKNIIFQGLLRINVNTMLTKIPIKIGDHIIDAKIKLTTKVLANTNNFDDIKIFKNKNIILIKVKERPLISNITFIGNHTIKKDDIKSIFDKNNIYIGTMLNKHVLHTIKNNLEEFYYSIGKYNFHLKIIINPLPYNRVNLKFIFNEGNNSKIKQINIIGNKHFSLNTLTKVFQLHQKVPWWNILQNRNYQKKILLEDLNALNLFYMAHGYAKFKINAMNLNLSPDKKDIYITLNINEGDQYKIENVILNCNNSDFTKTIHNYIKNIAGKLYNINDIKNIENKIKQLISPFGYAYPNIEIHQDTDDVNKSIILTFNIDVGQRYYIHNVFIQGNEYTKDVVIRRQIEQMEGSLFDINSVEKSKESLMRSGYYNGVEFQTKKISNSLNQVDLIFIVDEHNNGSINAGVGYGADSGLSFTFDASQNNWFGTGKTVNLNFRKGLYGTQVELFLSDPYFLDYNISLSTRLYYKRIQSNKANNVDISTESYGIDLTTSIPIFNKNILNIGIGISNNNEDDNSLQSLKLFTNVNKQANNSTESIDKKQLFSDKKIHQNNINSSLNSLDEIYPKREDLLSYKKTKSQKSILDFSNLFSSWKLNDYTINYGWEYNSLDRGFFPSKGAFMNFSGRVTLPFSHNHFFKMELLYQYYLPLDHYKKWIFTFRSTLGYIHPLKDQALPLHEIFYTGGGTSIRGFRNNAINVVEKDLKINNPECNIIDTDIDLSSNIIPSMLSATKQMPLSKQTKHKIDYDKCFKHIALGGNALLNSTIELITPTPFINDQYSDVIRTSVFIDVGNVWHVNFNFNSQEKFLNYSSAKQIYASAGVSLQWLSPIGPITISYAIPLVKCMKDKIERFQLVIGKNW